MKFKSLVPVKIILIIACIFCIDKIVIENKVLATSYSSSSSDTTLTMLGINPNDFSGFKSGIETYIVQVENTVEEVEVYATASNPSATIEGLGIVKLNEGENILNVIVTAIDGTTKTYTINITREASLNNEDIDTLNNSIEIQEDTDNLVNQKPLQNLEISEIYSISPKFINYIYNYDIVYIGLEEKLEIKTTLSNENYVVEIIGNENLVEGDNLIEILISDTEGNLLDTYKLNIEKKLSNDDFIQEKIEEIKENELYEKIKTAVITIFIIVFLILFVILSILYEKNKIFF